MLVRAFKFCSTLFSLSHTPFLSICLSTTQQPYCAHAKNGCSKDLHSLQWRPNALCRTYVSPMTNYKSYVWHPFSPLLSEDSHQRHILFTKKTVVGTYRVRDQPTLDTCLLEALRSGYRLIGKAMNLEKHFSCAVYLTFEHKFSCKQRFFATPFIIFQTPRQSTGMKPRSATVSNASLNKT